MSKDEQHDHEMMVEAIHDKRHRDPLPDNPPPGPKWQAKKGLYRLGLNGAEYSVLGCLIGQARQKERVGLVRNLSGAGPSAARGLWNVRSAPSTTRA